MHLDQLSDGPVGGSSAARPMDRLECAGGRLITEGG